MVPDRFHFFLFASVAKAFVFCLLNLAEANTKVPTQLLGGGVLVFPPYDTVPSPGNTEEP